MGGAAEVHALKKALTNAQNAGKAEEIKDILLKMKVEIRATEELLRETKVGLAVGKLRQHENAQIASLAKELVKKWKEEVGSGRSKADSKEGSVPQSPGASSKPSPSPSLQAGPSSASASTSALKPAQKDPTAQQQNTNGSSISTSSKPPVSSSDSKGKAPNAASPPPLTSHASNGEPRTTKTDKVDTQVTDDKTRNKCIELVYDSLAMDSGADSKLILERAIDIEVSAYRNIKDVGQYRNKMRSLYLNLKAKDNPELRASIVSGEIASSSLWSMTPQDMASAEKKAELAAFSKEALFNAQAAAPKKSETDMFECGKCKKRRCTYYQMQTRSADEPMTTFVRCLECGNNWRFS